jgi:hypothetical protein
MKLSDLRRSLDEATDPHRAIHSIAQATADALMHDSYGEAEWEKIIGYLVYQIPEDRVEAVMRSKYPRWAADRTRGKPSFEGFKAFIEANPHLLAAKALSQL